MTDDEMIEEMRKTRQWMQIQTLIFIALIAWIVLGGQQQQAQAGVSQEANPQITTNIKTPDEMERIEDMAADRGYYYKSEFAKKNGVSEKTVDRWRTAGIIISSTGDRGRVEIPLDAKPSKR